MRAVVQRVIRAQVTVDSECVGQIEAGLLVYLGVAQGDGDLDMAYMVDKLSHLRIFGDEAGKMNLSVQDIKGQILLVSNFTLCGDCRRGRRPGFDGAATPDVADALYQAVAEGLRQVDVPVETGQFQAHMHVECENDGPVTFLLDSRKLL
ncbi:MAG: D-tyrosyl-tRNA(Tyr) deacylase [Phycisphaeraceae bacterium]|nr:D-tyrosyl-tRNA(Tyr) deacylase [Phycisphaeraceae bacterium]